MIISFLDNDDYKYMLQFTPDEFKQQFMSSISIRQNVVFRYDELLESYLNGDNILVHGPGGVGKTFAINQLCQYINDPTDVYIMGTTGVSTLNYSHFNAQTIHGLFKIYKRINLDYIIKYDDETNEPIIPAKYNFLIKAKLFIIDEVSMLTIPLLNFMDGICKFVRNNTEPMGGIQVIMVGDFLQLPPVKSKFIFTCPTYHELQLKPIIFNIPYRQANQISFYKLLQRIRFNDLTPDDYTLLESRITQNIPLYYYDDLGSKIIPPFLFGTNVQVQTWNEKIFNRLPGFTFRIHAMDRYFRRRMVDNRPVYDRVAEPYHKTDLMRRVLVSIDVKQPRIFMFKNNMQVRITCNLLDKTFKNGDLCMIQFDEQEVYEQLNHVIPSDVDTYDLTPDMIITLPIYIVHQNGNRILLHKFITSFHNSYTFIGDSYYISRSQCYANIGYASTIHSAQGITSPKICIVLNRGVFGGSMYVACSRVTNINNLHLYCSDIKNQLRTHKMAREYVAQLEGYRLVTKPGILRRKRKAEECDLLKIY